MVRLSIPGWDKDKDKVYAAGDSFTPDFSGRPSRPRTAPPTPSTSLAPLFRLNSDASNRPEAFPFITLKLSSPSFLDSVVHDDLSDNPLYAIETVDNITKIRRSDTKGFITTSRVRWTANSRPSSAMRRSREFDEPCISFGNGSWKPVDEFLTFSYGTLSMSRKFYIPHHPNSLRWKRVGAVYHCLTNDIKGPVAILEPAVSATLPQLKVFNPIRSRDTSRPQKMHGGVQISLLDFLLATALLLVTEPNEWTNVTRPGPIDEPDEDDEIRAGPSHISRTSHGSSLSLSSRFNAQAPPEPQPLPPPVPNMPSVEQWRKTVPPLRATSPDALRSGSPSSPAQTSGGASHSSDSTDPLSTPASPGASHLFSFHSPSRQRFSSVPSLAGSSAPSRELPMPPLPVPRADQPWLHSYAGSSSSTPTPNPYFSPTHAASSSAPRSLPRTPVDVRKSIPSAPGSPPEGFALTPQPSSKPPPNYMASAHHAPVPLGLGFVQNPDEGLEPAMAGLSIETGGAEAGYDLPPPAYSAADAARSPWQNPAL